MNTELEALLATAEDTHRVDYVEVPVYDQETGAVSATRRISVRGATLFEQARFFMRFPTVFELISEQFEGADDTNLSEEDKKKRGAQGLKKVIELLLKIPEAISALNSCFVGQPFKPGVEEGLSRLNSDVSLDLLERGLFKTYNGDIQGFFAKRGGGLAKAMGLARKTTTTSTTSLPTSSTTANAA